MVGLSADINSTTCSRRIWREANPWLRHNLVRNPFGELTREEWCEAVILDSQWIDQCTDWIQDGRGIIELAGRKGRGKTTRLLALHRRMADSHYVYIGEDRAIPALPNASPLIIDEAQRLPRRIFKQILKAEVPLVLSTHWPLFWGLNRPRRPVRRQRIGKANNAELIDKIIRKRIELARYRPGPLPQVSQSQVSMLFKRHGTNLRTIEHALYQQWQDQFCHR